MLHFSEPVEAAFGTVRVVDAQGRRVDAGPAVHPRGRGEDVAVRLRPGLLEGGYTAAYRVIAADSHPASGAVSFSVGNGPPATPSVDELPAGARAGPVTATAFAAARAIQFAAIALALGALVFLLDAWLPALAPLARGEPEWQFASIAFARRLRAFQAPVALLLPANLLHVAAIGTWLGGLAVLLIAVRAATARLAPAHRTRLLAAVVARFSTLAAVAVTVVLAAGVTQAVASLNTLAHLLDTAYGRAVLIKAALFTALVALGAVNRRTRLPALRRAALENQEPGRTGLLLRRTLRAELTLAVFAATGALAGSAPVSALRPAPTAGRSNHSARPARRYRRPAHASPRRQSTPTAWTAVLRRFVAV